VQAEYRASENSVPPSYNMDLKQSECQIPQAPIVDQNLLRRWGPLIMDWRVLRQIYREKGEYSFWVTAALVLGSLCAYIILIINISSFSEVDPTTTVFSRFGGTLLAALWIISLCAIIYRVSFPRLFRAIRSGVSKWL
jgi:hypothetical protein